MKAAVLLEAGRELAVDELDLAPPAPGFVRVKLAASGVCRSDLSIANGTIPQPLPAVLGHEGAGVVTECGPGVRAVTPGDHVILSWITPCRRCFHCLRGEIVLCERGLDHAYAGPYAVGSNGPVHAAFGTATFGEETVVPEGACVVIDRDFPLDLGALIGCGVVTGVGSVLNSAHVQAGESVAVVGCGGVGLAAIQGARLAGADPIIAVDRVAAKFDLARRCGATAIVDASSAEPVAAVRDLTGGRGTDHAFEVVGNSATIVQAYQMTRRAGTVTIVGAGRFDDNVQFGAMQLMVDMKTVRGCVYGATDPARDFPEMIRLHRSGKLDLDALVSRRIALDEVNDAFRAMDEGAGDLARSVIVYP